MKSLFRFFSETRGAAAVEFGLVVPVMAAALVGLIDVGSMVFDRSDMHSAARAGVQYFMSGGSDYDRAQEVVIQAWDKMPEGATVTVEPYCLCGSTENACYTLCPDSSAPTMFARFKLTGTIGLQMFETSDTVQELVRVR